MQVASTIVCPECGGRCGMLQPLGPDDDLEPGDIVAYRCPDCEERFDVVVDIDDIDDLDGFGASPLL